MKHVFLLELFPSPQVTNVYGVSMVYYVPVTAEFFIDYLI